MHLSLDTSGGRPLHAQIFDAIREAIAVGRLAPGARLPSTRTLASDLGVSRTTVLAVFDRLVAEGLVVANVGAGTRVSHPSPQRVVRRPARETTAERPPPPAILGRAGTALVEGGDKRRHASSTVPFSMGVPALEVFPVDVWSRLTTRRWRTSAREFLLPTDRAGYPPLREAITRYVANARGIRCLPEQVVVVNGAQQGVDLAARLLLDAVDDVWLEAPGYAPVRAALAATGARLVNVPVDEEGLQVAEGVRLAPDARLAFVTPATQAPTGVTMSLARRRALLDWAVTRGAWIVEDDVGGEYRFDANEAPMLQALDTDDRVIHVGSFNRALFPALRLGYVILPRSLVEAFVRARLATDSHATGVEQAVLADFITEGHFARHVRRTRELYRERLQRLLAIAQPALGELLELRPAAAGMRLFGWLPQGVDDACVVREALRRGLRVEALSHYAGGPPLERGGLLLGYAAFSEAQLRQGVPQLVDAIRAAAAPDRTAPRDPSGSRAL
jgi:GntR family transcriptional regulator/MocR family aminotransferase